MLSQLLLSMLIWFDHRGQQGPPQPAPSIEGGGEHGGQPTTHLLVVGAAPHASFPHSLTAGDDGGTLVAPDGSVFAAVVHIAAPADQETARSMVGCVPWVYCEFPEVAHGRTGADNMFIPVENLIASMTNTGTKLAVKVRTAEEVQGVALALQQGADAIVLDSDAPQDVLDAVAVALEQRLAAAAATAAATPGEVVSDGSGGGAELVACRVVAVSPGGMADRVCLDMTCLLTSDEGALLGSSAKALVLVHGETEATGFVPAR